MKTVKSESSSDDDSSDEDDEEIFYTKKMVCKSYTSLKSKKLMSSPMLRSKSLMRWIYLLIEKFVIHKWISHK